MKHHPRPWACLILVLSSVFFLSRCTGAQPAPTPTPPPPTPTAEPWLQITFPPERGIIPNPVIVEGVAGPGAQTIRVQVRDPQGIPLGEQSITFSEVQQGFRAFSLQISYASPDQRMPGTIEAYFNDVSEPAAQVAVVLGP